MNEIVEPSLRTSSSSRRVEIALVVGFLIAMVFSFGAPFCARDGVEGVDAFVEAAKKMSKDVRAGDRVVVHPPWRDDVVSAIIAAKVLPKGTDVSEAFAPRHAKKWGRVWFLVDSAAPGLAPAWKRRIASFGQTLDDKGGVRTILVDDSVGKAIGFGALLPRALVHVESKTGGVTRCKWSRAKSRHVCGGLPGWMHVGEEEITTKGKKERCIWAHPTTGGHVRIRFENVHVGERLKLSHALADSALKNKKGEPVTASIKVDGVLLGRHAKQNRAGFDGKTFTVPKGKRGDGKNVEIDITTFNDGARHYCFRLSNDSGATSSNGTK